MKTKTDLETCNHTRQPMKTVKFTVAALCIAWLVSMTLYAQTRCHSPQVRRKAPRPVWEIIHRTDLSR